MSSSDFTCRCGYRLGDVKSGVLRHEPNVPVRNYLRKGYAEVTCPRCRRERAFRGNGVEMRQMDGAKPSELEIDRDFLVSYGLPVDGDDPVAEAIRSFGLDTAESNIVLDDGNVYPKVELVGPSLPRTFWQWGNSLNEARRLAFAEYLVHVQGKRRQ